MLNQVIYSAWIHEWIRKCGTYNGYGLCKEACEAMSAQFPELEIRKGLFHSLVWGDRQHWWLRDRSTLAIVDPTAQQHPDGVVFPRADSDSYTDLTDMSAEEAARRRLVPLGRCMECGDPVFDTNDSGLCSKACLNALQKALDG